MDTQKAIEQLGYKPSEAKVYIVLLQIGEATASYVASRIKLPRTSVLDILQKLHKDGLVSFYIKKRYKYWAAEQPQRLMTLLKEKESKLQQILPTLISYKQQIGDRPTVHVYIGVEEIKQIHADIIETKHHMLALLPWDCWVGLFGEEFINDFTALRVSHFLQQQLLTPKTQLAERRRTHDRDELRQTRFLPSRISINTATLIYDNKVAIITLNKRQPTGIVTYDADIATTMRELFEELWTSSV